MTKLGIMYNDKNPIPPEILANALQDPIHINIGKTRLVKAVKSKVKPKIVKFDD